MSESPYFHTNDTRTIEFIARVATLAAEQGQSLRFKVNSDGDLQVKRGESVWTAPFMSDPDPYRDKPLPRDEREAQEVVEAVRSPRFPLPLEHVWLAEEESVWQPMSTRLPRDASL